MSRGRCFGGLILILVVKVASTVHATTTTSGVDIAGTPGNFSAAEKALMCHISLLKVQTDKMEHLFSLFEAKLYQIDELHRTQNTAQNTEVEKYNFERKRLHLQSQDDVMLLTAKYQRKLLFLQKTFGNSAVFDEVARNLNDINKQMIKRMMMVPGTHVLFQNRTGVWLQATVTRRTGKFFEVRVHISNEIFGEVESFQLELQGDRENSKCTGFKKTHDEVRGVKKASLARVPKTGSTSMMEVLGINKCLSEHVVLFDHGDGCENLAQCNATCNAQAPGPAFGVIRDPCTRFKSSAMQLASELPRDHAFGKRLWHLSESRAIDVLLEFFEASGCTHNIDPGCLVRYINIESRQWGERWQARVIMYPQSFFVNMDYNLVCFSSTEMLPKLIEGITNATGCPPSPPALLTIHRNYRYYDATYEMTRQTCQRVREIMAADAALFDASCPHSQSATH